jgi:hypothetical protein
MVEEKNKAANLAPEAEAQKLALIAQSRETQKAISLSGGLRPASLDQLVFIAKLYQDSGLAPSSFKTWQQIAVAMSMCMEVGRPVATGLQDMAVINGRVGIYGDAALAIIRGSGLLEYIKEEETGEPFTDKWTFTCKVKRKGEDERIGKWTWAQSIRAGFDNPQKREGGTATTSPWLRFTEQMMKFKARNFVLRDTFGDILKGIRTKEELLDIETEEVPTQVERLPQPHTLEIKPSPFEENRPIGPPLTWQCIRCKNWFAHENAPHECSYAAEAEKAALKQAIPGSNVPVIPEIPAESKIDREIRETPIEKINGMIKEPTQRPPTEAPNTGSSGQQTETGRTQEPGPATGDSNGHTPSEHGEWFDAIKSARPSRSREARSAFEKLVNDNLATIYALPEKDYKYVEKKYKEAFKVNLPSIDDAPPWEEDEAAPAESNLSDGQNNAPSELGVKFNDFVYDFSDATTKTNFINPQEGIRALNAFTVVQAKHVPADDMILFVNFLNEIVEAGQLSFRTVPAMKTMVEYNGMTNRLFEVYELWKEEQSKQ